MGRQPLLPRKQLKGISNVHEISPTVNDDGRYAIAKAGAFEAEQIWFWGKR